MRERGVTANGTDMVCEGGPTAQSTLETGRMTRNTGRENRDMAMVPNTMGIGKTTKDAGMEGLYIRMVVSIMGSGDETSGKAMEFIQIQLERWRPVSGEIITWSQLRQAGLATDRIP